MDLAQFLGEYWELLEWASIALIGLALLVSYIVAVRLGAGDSPTRLLRERLVLGIPWGTFVVVGGLVFVYYVVQGGSKPVGPNVVGFRSWSLWYPEGLLLSSFSHASDGHLTGNVLGTVLFGSLVEYAWSHYPTTRGSHSFSSWKTNPFGRIGLFVAGTVLIGVLGAVVIPGAVIGFSSVVFAFAGFAIVFRPLLAAGGMLGLEVLDMLYDGMASPITITESREQFVTPWWANTAVQGHLFGMVVGVLLAAALFRYRKESPRLRYIWFGAVVFAADRSMWAVYWFLGGSEYVLFQGVGAASVLALAAVVALAALSVERPLQVPRVGVPVRTVATTVLVGLVVVIALAGIPYNLVGVSPGEDVENGIDVDGYTVTYAENVENQYTSLDLPVANDALSVEMSGVIIASDERNVWALDTPKDELAFRGWTYVVVGDTTWRELVFMNHTQWEVIGGNTTYKVFGQHLGEMDDQRLLYAADPAEAGPTLNGTRISIAPAEEFYDIVVRRDNETIGRTQVPAHNQTADIAGITFERTENELTAIHDRTEISLATYRIERDV
jgi:membrane associated rhomboid family serine protease